MKNNLLILWFTLITLLGHAQVTNSGVSGGQATTFGIVGRAAMDVIELKDFNDAITNSITVLDKIAISTTFYYDAKNKPLIYNADKSFVLQFRPKDGSIRFKEGVLLLGYFTRHIGETVKVVKDGLISIVPSDPEAIARMYASYLLIKKAESMGGDLLLGPIVSTNVSVVDKNTDLITVNISCKLVKINSSK